MTDLAQDVLELAERSIRHSGAGSEGFRVSVNWLPQVTPLGSSIAWLILITMPSHMIGQPAIAVTCSPIMSPSVPREHEVSAAVAEALPKLVTWISGPSATADIEMTRIKGVHGPRFLNVILVRG